MKIAIGFDHGGLNLRAVVIERIEAASFEVLDLGPQVDEKVDYPEYAHKVARAVKSGEAVLGILVCGTGLGMSMAANRHKGIRAAVCTTTYMAKMARAHNDANVLCLGDRVIGTGLATDILDSFIATSFEGGRHAKRIEMIDQQKRSGEQAS